MAFRDQFFSALRGKASFESKKLGGSADVELAVVAPDHARLEFAGPLGIRLALLLINDDWVYLFVPRENSVIRFPKAELFKDTFRRERFLKMLPLPVVPEAFFQGLLTQVGGLPKAGAPLPPGTVCEVDDEMNAYRLRLVGNSLSQLGGRFVWVDGVDFYPLKIVYFERNLPEKWDAAGARPSFEIEFSKFAGLGASTLPKQFEMRTGREKVLDFEWSSAEVWDAPNMSAFDWRPSASMDVRDY